MAAAVLTAAGLLAAVLAGEYVRREGEGLLARAMPAVGNDWRPVAIVPGAAVWAGGVPCPMLEDRVLTAVALYREGRVSRVILSGNREPGYDEPAAMRRLALSKGVPAAALVCDERGFTTRETMRRAAGVFAVRDAVIVSQAFHLPRALFLARAAGLNALGAVADRREYAGIGKDRAREFFARIKAWLQEF